MGIEQGLHRLKTRCPFGRIGRQPHGSIEPCAVTQRLTQDLIEAIIGGIGDGRLESVAQGRRCRAIAASCVSRRRTGQHHVDSLALQLARHLVFENGKAWRHAGFERKALQKTFTKRVDGLHLESARRFDGRCKKRARERDFSGRRLLPGQLLQRRCQIRRCQHDPRGQLVEHALGHFGGSRLSIGETQDAARRRAT